MSFASDLTRCPIPHDPDRGTEGAELFPDLPPDLSDLIRGAAGCSPYLLGLMTRETAWCQETLMTDPIAAVDVELGRLKEVAPDALATELRVAKRRVALLTALMDLGGAWPLERVTGTLTEFADLATDLAMKAALSNEIRRNKLPGMTEDDLPEACGMVALAMGKMGAHELNYSSDIDLICLFDETRFDDADYQDARASFIRATRKFAAMLSDLTADGYVFRTDLRLRPDPSVTPVCLSMDAAERYYESVGRTWERAAHIKARPCAGDIAAGDKYLDRLRPFIWRKHLDFAAIQDAHDMRLRIREHKGLGGPITLPGHNMKLGRGGIREIEFFTQTRQIIAGGRDPELRVRETVAGLAVLARKEWIPEDVAQVLTDHYRHHRTVEHRVQMIADAQTHDLPNSEDGFQRLADFMGGGDAGALRKELFDRLTEVHDVTESFFAPTQTAPAPELSDASAEVVKRWHTYPALRSDRAQEIFERLRPEILHRMERAAKPDEALRQFDGFLSGLPAGVQLLSLFEANPQLIDLLVDICATAPALAQYLSHNSGVLDAVLGGSFFEDWPGVERLTQVLTRAMGEGDDYELQLDALRRAHHEWHFRIGVHHLRGLISAARAGQQYADLAEAAVAALYPVVIAEFSRKHGPPPGNGATVLGMGSLGAQRLNSRSDLDLIVIYDADGVEGSDGRRALATRPYYARLTQALVTALTAPMSHGRLYEVDMRLRPSGRQGPVATALQSFRNYQRDEAWTWEHLALTRARAMAGSDAVGQAVTSFRAALLSEKGAPEKVVQDVVDMRARLADAKPATHTWEAKLGPGRLQDIELLAQAGALMAGLTDTDIMAQIAACGSLGWIDADGVRTLSVAADRLWTLQIGAKLLSEKPLDLDEVGQGGRDFMLRETGTGSVDDLRAQMQTLAKGAAEVIDAALSQPPRG